MSIFDSVEKAAKAERVVSLENRADGLQIKGDFDGSVTGVWQRLDQTGVGIVRYKGKDYKVKAIGFQSLAKGTPVELTYGKGIYFAKF